MRIDELRKMKRNPEMPLGTHTATFRRIQYRIVDDEVRGIFVHTDEYRSLYVPFFDNGNNYQLDFLLEQLNCDSYNDEDINQKAGTQIICNRYLAGDMQEFVNVSFNPKAEQQTVFA